MTSHLRAAKKYCAVNCHGVWSQKPMEKDELEFQLSMMETVPHHTFQGNEEEVAEWIEGARMARVAFANMVKQYVKEQSPKEQSPKEQSPKEQSPKEQSPKEQSPKDTTPHSKGVQDFLKSLSVLMDA